MQGHFEAVDPEKIAKGGLLPELHDHVQTLMADPEGNRFMVVLDPDHEA
ncbi:MULTISPECIES: hypothetical protein [unclassified Streptomyces]